MKITRKTTITTINSDEILIVRRLGTEVLACPVCDTGLRMLPLTEAAFYLQVSQRTVWQWIEAGLIHFSETADGRLFVCVNGERRHNE